MKRKFCCDESRDLYTDYYVNQSGSGMPVYTGARVQRGHGLGSILSGLFRSAIPIFRKGLSWIGRQALDKGAQLAGQVARDVAEGKPFIDSTKSRVKETINEYVPGVIDQTGSGRRRRRINKKRRNTDVKRKRSKKTKRDILD